MIKPIPVESKDTAEEVTGFFCDIKKPGMLMRLPKTSSSKIYIKKTDYKNVHPKLLTQLRTQL